MSTAHKVTRIIAVASTAAASFQAYWLKRGEADSKVIYRDLLHTESLLTNERLTVKGLVQRNAELEEKILTQQEKTEDFVSITACIIPMISLGMYAMVNSLLRERGY